VYDFLLLLLLLLNEYY